MLSKLPYKLVTHNIHLLHPVIKDVVFPVLQVQYMFILHKFFQSLKYQIFRLMLNLLICSFIVKNKKPEHLGCTKLILKHEL
jgi:hypothetical protein